MAVDMFLKLDGIKGESPDAKHKDEIQIQSFSFGVHQTGTSADGGGSGAGKASFEDIHITKAADIATPPLMEACATGKHIKSAILTVRKAGGKQEEYYKIKLTDLLVSNLSNTGHGNEQPMEQLSMNFAKIEFEYYPQKADGTLGGVSKAGYDIKKNVKV
jgi:type VI secretion system secreted protein Hcp